MPYVRCFVILGWPACVRIRVGGLQRILGLSLSSRVTREPQAQQVVLGILMLVVNRTSRMAAPTGQDRVFTERILSSAIAVQLVT